MFPKPTKPYLRFLLLTIDLSLVVLVVFMLTNIFSPTSVKTFLETPKDVLPKLTAIPTLPLAKVLGLTSFNSPTKKPVVTIPSSTNQLLSLVNSERQSKGLPPLTLDSKLTSLASSYSQEMSSKHFFSHVDPQGKSPFDRLAASGVSFQSAGENIAFAPTVTIAHTNLMNSEDHRNNILNPSYSKIGIGIFKESQTKLLFTQIFTN